MTLLVTRRKGSTAMMQVTPLESLNVYLFPPFIKDCMRSLYSVRRFVILAKASCIGWLVKLEIIYWEHDMGDGGSGMAV